MSIAISDSQTCPASITSHLLSLYPAPAPADMTHFNIGKYVITGNIRSVVPYIHTFKCYAKGRWLGRPIVDVLATEFGAHPLEYWGNAIRLGHVRVNHKLVNESYIFRNSDMLIHQTHR